MSIRRAVLIGGYVACVWSSLALVLAAAELSPGHPVDFNRDVRPILTQNCFTCHGPDQAAREADLRLDTHSGALAVLEPGHPDQSELVSRLFTAEADLLMPPPASGKQLSQAQKETLRQWIAQGAVYDVHWAFQPPQPVPPPAVPGVSHPIDCFIQARLGQANLNPSPLASPTTRIRRLSLDLVGLPPSTEEMEAFVAASAIDAKAAYHDLIERLLASPHHGERWARWWLDQARYADSNGYSIDAPRQIWKYRDWVIDALNADMPFDQFTIEQLAGDLLPAATIDQRIATGFHRNTQINQEGGIDKEQFRIDSVFDRVATTGTVWLGLSVGCAQCHDHKFDPISQTEFYQLFAFLNNQDEPTLRVPRSSDEQIAADRQAAQSALRQLFEQQAAQLFDWQTSLTEKAISDLPAKTRRALELAPEKRGFDDLRLLFAAMGSSDRFDQLDRNYRRHDKAYQDADTTLVLAERAQPRTTQVLIKGDFTRPAEVVTPGLPAVLHPMADQPSPSDRLDLARWITQDNNPLTARVIVNRIWQSYFGRGLVETEDDFGLQGSPPSHGELLDWLAVQFIDQGWSLKAMHRLIVTSHTYQQSSRQRPDLQEFDPGNYLLGRQSRLRLDAEIVRDVALRASGLLATQIGGPPVHPPIPEGVMNQGQVKRGWPTSLGGDRYRRGLYTFVFRATPPPALNVFDTPDGYSTCTRRVRSNTPLQALTLMNDPAWFEFASSLQGIIHRDGLAVAFERCTSRKPDADELAILSKLDSLTAARTLLNLDETITRE